MASVFLSYDRSDAARARPVALALEKAGHRVWWDSHIKGGAEYAREIEQALKQAEAVVVLWSAHSVQSAWVRDEAAAGRDTGRLVPALLDGTEPPLGFRQLQNIDLSHWKGRSRAPEFRELLDAVGTTAERSELAEPASPAGPPRLTKPRQFRRAVLAGLAVALLLAAAAIGWWLTRKSSSIPVVVIAAADQSPTSKELARNLLVNLGSLNAARTNALQLLGPETATSYKADFIFEASAGGDAHQPRANLALIAGKDRGLLWSKDFRAEGVRRDDIEQRAAYSAAQVLSCALEADASKAQPEQATFRVFLNGCAMFADRYRIDPRAVVPIFSLVVAKAPRFEPAWAKLLLAEAQVTRAQMLLFDRYVPGALPEHIAAVRKFNPRLPELYIAESALLPLAAFTERSRLVDEAVRLNPDNPHLLVVRAEFLSSVGRNTELVNDAARAAELDPLSPGFSSNLIQSLAYSGRLSAAREELVRAMKLWPGAQAIEDARFRLHSRYGDPAEALRIFHSQAARQLYVTPDYEAYLQAKIDPTEANIERAIAATRNPEWGPTRQLVQLVQLLADLGREEEIYGLAFRMRKREQLGLLMSVMFRPAFSKFRQDPRFIQIAARGGLLDYWRRSGRWPDFCFEPELPYDCKAEAAKIQ